MEIKPSYPALFVGLLLLVGAAFLPIDRDVVRRHTLDGMARDALGAVGEGVVGPVRLDFTDTAAADVATLTAAVRGATVEVDDRRQPRFEVVERADAPPLTLSSAAPDDDRLTLTARLGEGEVVERGARWATWTSLLPPLVALVLAIGLRRVVPALFMAVFVGATLLHGGNPLWALWVEISSLFGALGAVVGVGASDSPGYLAAVLADSFNLQILGFTFALVGLVAVVSRMGGTRGLVNALAPLARGPRSAQAVTAGMGAAVFFDDYANTVVIGTTARSLTDEHRLSREKLAYIVDSTSAPVAGIAIVSTWIGYEVGLFDDLLGTLSAVPGMPGSGYELFFSVLPLRFYCLFALALVFIGAITGRDLGPMLAAERRARAGGPLSPAGAVEGEPTSIEKPGVTPRAINAIVPIGAVLGATLAWLLIAGTAPMARFSPLSLTDWKQVFDNAGGDIALILLVTALGGSVLAIGMAVAQRLLGLREAVGAYGDGMRTLAEAAAVLIAAWGIKAVCDDLGTGLAIIALIGDGLPPLWIPLTVFVLSGAIAFSTGTSWGTMALVLPIAAPLSATLSGDPLIVLASLGAVLDGAIWGDHCSPISDTTVLSSTASGCPHLAHVRTQIPYATLAMGAAGLWGYVGVSGGLPLWAAYGLGLVTMVGVMLVFGRSAGPVKAAAPGG